MIRPIVALALTLLVFPAAAKPASPPQPLPPLQAGTLFCRLKDGTLLNVLQRGTADGLSELAARSSKDNGATWSEPETLMRLDKEHSRWGFGEVLLDKDDELHAFFMIAGDKDIPTGGEQQRPLIGALAGVRIDIGYARSFDHRTRWSAPHKLWIGYTGALNSVIQMDSGRILLPFSYLTKRDWFHRGEGVDAFTFVGQYDSVVLYSDDGGATWKLGNSLRTPVPDIVSAYGAVEPVVVQLADGRVWMLIRTQMGHFWESWSLDGANWSAPAPTDIISSDSPAGLVRLSDGRIVLLWNNSLRYPYAYGGRQVLHAAISDDNAHTWRGHREVGRDPLRNELPSNEGDYGTAYPMPSLANHDRVLFMSGQGRGRVLRESMDPNWLTETWQSADFSTCAEEWSTFGTKGVTIEPDPSKHGARVLALRKTHSQWPAAAVWNFPSGAAGRLRMRIMARPGSAGALVGITDHFSTPFDLEDYLNNVFNVRFGPEGDVPLATGRWHDVELRWSVWQQACRVLVDGEQAAVLPMNRFGRYPSYLRLRSLAEKTNAAGMLVESVKVAVDPTPPAKVRADNLRETSLATLRATMARETTIRAMHAAEALVWTGFTEGVRERYKPALTAPDAHDRIAARRVLAQLSGISHAERARHVLGIRDMALDPKSPTADFAIESLAKVGYAGRDREFVRRAEHAAPVMRILARWVLANGGGSAAKPSVSRPRAGTPASRKAYLDQYLHARSKAERERLAVQAHPIPAVEMTYRRLRRSAHEDEARLAAMLDSHDKQAPGIAAYALRFLKRLQPGTIAHLRLRLAAMPAKAEGRVYVVSALYLYDPAGMRREMLRYIRTGTADERYEALLVYGRRATARDLTMLAPYLRHADADTRTAAACSVLRILGPAANRR